MKIKGVQSRSELFLIQFPTVGRRYKHMLLINMLYGVIEWTTFTFNHLCNYF